MTEVAAIGLVVVSHPDQTSLNHALAASIARAWDEMSIPTRFVDLHAIGFNPVLSPEEARGMSSTDSDVRTQIGFLLKADLVAVVHPNCWESPPAMMKGWMDRVFAPEAAYAFAKGEDDGEAPIGLLRGKRALVINTSNTSLERETEAFGDPLERIWRDCLLGYCGFSSVRRRVFRIVATSSAADRATWIDEAACDARLIAGG